MGERNVFSNESSNLLEEWHESYISPSKQRGFVATLDLSFKKYKYAYESYWGLNDKGKLVAISNRKEKRLTNVFLSLNAFESKNGQLKRRVDHLAQIRNIGVDIDCYKVGLSVEQATEKIKALIYQFKMPNPNLFIRSGNGIQLIYSIENGAAPTDQIKWLTTYITTQLTASVMALGADFSAITLERVFRLPGTYNEKPNKPKKIVEVEIWRQLEYSLQDLYEYCTPYDRSKNKTKVIPLPGYKTHGNHVKALNLARCSDFIKIVEIRNGDIDKRNVLTYDYCFSLTLNDLSLLEVTEAARQLDSSFNTPQKPNTVKRTAKSAYNDATAFWKAFSENGYIMKGLDKNLIKPKKHTTLIDHHDITDQEQTFLTAIINATEKYNRKVAKRRAAGIKERSEYERDRQAQKNSRLEELRVLKEQKPKAKQQELADLLGVSLPTVKKYIAQLKQKV